MQRKCGYVALLGRPNAGKSTLLNALVGDKLAVVSRKPQTTRNRILGIAMADETQILFLDTPGLHRDKGKNLINTVMNRVALHVASEADLLVYLVDATRGFIEEDHKFLGRVLQTSGQKPLLLLLSKWDTLDSAGRAQALVRFDASLDLFFAEPENAAHKPRLINRDPEPISAKRPEEVAQLRAGLAELMPEGEWLYADDDLTDMPRNFIAAELIREQIFRQLGQEIPYGTAVKVEGIEFKDAMVVVRAVAMVTRKAHKPIILGKGGSRIKSIGTEARASLEKHFGKKVFLDLSVSVAEGWIDDQRLIAELASLQDLNSVLEMTT